MATSVQPRWRVALIVEGHYDVGAAAVLVNRWFRHRRFLNFHVAEDEVIRASGQPNLKALPRENPPERGVERWLNIARTRRPAFILVLLDAEDDCQLRARAGEEPLGVELTRRARHHCPDIPVDVVVVDRKFESWFLSLPVLTALRQAGQLATTQPLRAASAQALGRVDHKRELKTLRGPLGYSPSVDQAELARYVPFTRAMQRRSLSFHKLVQKLERLAGAARRQHRRRPRPG